MSVDAKVFLWINGLGGRFPPLDRLISNLANDYFVIVGFCLVLLFLWFGSRKGRESTINQTGVICASISLGLSQLVVYLINVIYMRPRPFFSLPAHLLFYRPTDPSFPANSTTVIFAMAVAIFLWNKRVGIWMLLIAAFHGFARVYVGVHFPTDILAGAAIGTLMSVGVSIVVKKLDFLVQKLLDFLRPYQLS